MITEIGTGCAVNLPQFARHYEQMGAEQADDAVYYRDKLDQFLADWNKWDLGRIWTRPEDYFTDSERNMIKLRRETGNALRAIRTWPVITFAPCRIRISTGWACSIVSASSSRAWWNCKMISRRPFAGVFLPSR